MADPFAEFENNNGASNGANNEDPAAAFLAREELEFAKIVNNEEAENNNGDGFGSFDAPADNQEKESSDPFGIDGGSQAQDNKSGDLYSAISSADRFSQEPEKIKKWREEQKQRLAQKDTEEEQKKKEWKETAKKELEDWYKNRSEQLAKTHANNKVSNKAAEAELCATRDSAAPGQEWDRMAKLCDFNPKANKNTKDVSRMRSILLQLKQQPLVRQAN